MYLRRLISIIRGVQFMGWTLIVVLCGANPATAPERPSRDALWRQLETFTRPPAELADDVGDYRSPLDFADGSKVEKPADWAQRRKEILETWHRRLGPWPSLVEKPEVKRLATIKREGYTEHHVHVQISNDGKLADGYLLIPQGQGPFPAVLVPFYE